MPEAAPAGGGLENLQAPELAAAAAHLRLGPPGGSPMTTVALFDQGLTQILQGMAGQLLSLQGAFAEPVSIDGGTVDLSGTLINGEHDDKPGVRRLLTPQDMPAIARPTDGVAEVVAMPAGAGPQVPDGFSAELVTTSGLHLPHGIPVHERAALNDTSVPDWGRLEWPCTDVRLRVHQIG